MSQVSLRLRTTTLSSAGTGDVVAVRLASGEWEESALTFGNRPAVGAEVGTATGLTGPSVTVEVPLDAAALQPYAGRSVTLALTNDGPDSAWLTTRESRSVQPALTIQYAATP